LYGINTSEVPPYLLKVASEKKSRTEFDGSWSLGVLCHLRCDGIRALTLTEA